MESLTDITISDLKEMSVLELSCFNALIVAEIERCMIQNKLLFKRIEQLDKIVKEVVNIRDAKKSVIEDGVSNLGNDLLTIQMHHVLRILKECGWSRTQAAKKLGKSRRTLLRLLDKFREKGIAIPESLFDTRKGLYKRKRIINSRGD